VSLQLTEEEKRELRQTNGKPVRLTDPETKQEYVLIRAEAYDRLKALLYDDSDPDVAAGYPLADEVMKEDWDDPKMVEYDRYDELKQ